MLPSLDQVLQQAVTFQQAGRLDEAEAIYRQVLSAQPDHADTLHLLGVLASQSGRYEEACELMARAIALSPGNATYYRNLGTAYRHRGMLEQTIAAWQRAISLKPNSPDLLNSLGTAWQETKQRGEAMVCFRRAIAMSPRYAHAHYNLGCLMDEKGETELAVQSYQRVLEIQPEYAEASNNLGKIFKDKGRLEESIRCYSRAIQSNPRFLDAYHNLLFVKLYDPASTALSLKEELQGWNEQFAKPLAGEIEPHFNHPDPKRRLRIGYVSADFRSHVVARFYILNLLAHRDRALFEVFCYAHVPTPDAMTARLQGLADHWRNILLKSDEQVARMVRDDQIDILVDLSLHTAGSRLLVFARKPAPVQMTMGGYPGSTGLETVDCRLTDPYLDPPGMWDEYYSEQSARMPDTFWCDPAIEHEPLVDVLPALINGYVTFGSLNNFCKVNEELLGQWAKVLHGVRDSRLIVLAPEGDPRRKVTDVLAALGIDRSRVECVGMQKRLAYLATYNRIDIGLDTWPFNGHSTSFDSFWMGVPVITWVGSTVVGRAGVSQLLNLGLEKLIGQTADQFVEIAIGLAHDLPRLAEIRSTLRNRMQKSPLMDAGAFMRGIEGIYRLRWQKWCAAQLEK